MKLSRPQLRVLNRMSHGASLSLEISTGRYLLADGPITRAISPQTVEVLKNRQLIEGTISGHFTLRPSK